MPSTDATQIADEEFKLTTFVANNADNTVSIRFEFGATLAPFFVLQEVGATLAPFFMFQKSASSILATPLWARLEELGISQYRLIKDYGISNMASGLRSWADQHRVRWC